MGRLQLAHVPLAEFQIGDLVWARARSADPFWPVRGLLLRAACGFSYTLCCACAPRLARSARRRAALTPCAAQGRLADPFSRAEVPENVAAAAQRDSLCVMFFGPSCAKVRRADRRFARQAACSGARAAARGRAGRAAAPPARRRACPVQARVCRLRRPRVARAKRATLRGCGRGSCTRCKSTSPSWRHAPAAGRSAGGSCQAS